MKAQTKAGSHLWASQGPCPLLHGSNAQLPQNDQLPSLPLDTLPSAPTPRSSGLLSVPALGQEVYLSCPWALLVFWTEGCWEDCPLETGDVFLSGVLLSLLKFSQLPYLLVKVNRTTHLQTSKATHKWGKNIALYNSSNCLSNM